MKSPRKFDKRRRKKHVLKNKLAYIFLVFVFILVCFLVYSHLNPSNETLFDQTPKAAIVDHLSISHPNPDFNTTAMSIINAAGLPVDYYPGEKVTVDFYRSLPRHNYKVIIFRVHSTGECSVEGQPPFVVFFSSEEYSNIKHVSDQLAMRVVYVNFPEPQPPGFFGITPTFVRDSMKGRFNDTIIIAMGCDGLTHTTMAEAFIERGAKAYVGWDGPVAAGHTDKAITNLLTHLITERQTIKDSVANTLKEAGPDPIDQSILTFYPKEAASYTIPDYANHLALHTPEIHLNTLKQTRHQTFSTLKYYVQHKIHNDARACR